MIVLQSVTKSYGDVRAVNGVTLAISRGEFAFLMGTNGAGKTTLLRLISREEHPDAGVVLVGGGNTAELTGPGLTRLRRRMGVVYQDTRLMPNATVAENVALPLRVRGMGGAALTKNVTTVLDRVRLADKQARFPRELSGGEQRKVAIARAVVANPEILLCDEPTESLSAERAAEIVDLLLDINADGVTTVVATHDTGTVNRLRRRVIHMDSGCVQSDTLVGSAAPPLPANGDA